MYYTVLYSIILCCTVRLYDSTTVRSTKHIYLPHNFIIDDIQKIKSDNTEKEIKCNCSLFKLIFSCPGISVTF